MKVAANLLFTLALITTLLLVGSYQPRVVYGPAYQLHRTVRDCQRCHQPWTAPSAQTCTTGVCHAELGLAARPRTPMQHFHELVGETACRSCHPEHKGPAARPRFQHGIIPTRHAAACERCHASPPRLATGAPHPPPQPGALPGAPSTAPGPTCVACHVSDRTWQKTVLPPP